MKLVKNILKAAAVFALASLTFVSCGKSAWLTDLSEAKKQAQKKDKEILLLISGDDWVTESEEFKKNIADTKEFIAKYGKENVLVNIDFSQKVFEKTNVTEESSKKEKKEAEKIKAEYVVKEKIGRTYAVQNFPALYVLSKEGFVLANVSDLTSKTTLEEFDSGLKEYAEDMDSVRDKINVVRASGGIDRALAINALYTDTPSEYLGPLIDLVREVPALDPNNESGIVGDMLFFAAYCDSADLLQTDPEAASKVFEDAAQSEYLTIEEKQNAYYMAAYILSYSNAGSFSDVEALLQKGYELDTTTETAKTLSEVIDHVRQMAESVSDQGEAELN